MLHLPFAVLLIYLLGNHVINCLLGTTPSIQKRTCFSIMRNLLLFLALVGIFVVGKRSCQGFSFGFPGSGINGSGAVKTEPRSVSDFHALDLSLAGNVEFSVSDHYSVEVQAQENLLPILKTEVENGKLKIYFSENVRQSQDIKIRVSAPSFEALELAGSGTMRAMTAIKSSRMSMEVSGSGNLYLSQGEFGEVDCAISGSGGIELGGTANTLKVDVSGSGEVQAKELTTNSLDAEVAGSGTISCHVVQTLKADIAGSGEVFYSGTPTVDADVSGSGKVKRL